MGKVLDENYFQISGFMVNRLHLKGNELMVYAIIYGFSQSINYCYASYEYIAEFTGASRQTIINSVQSLLDKNLIEKVGTTENGTNVYVVKNLDLVKKFDPPSQNSVPPLVKNFDPPSQKILPNNIIYNNNNKIYNNISETEKANQSDKKKKSKMGEYKNVLLSQDEYEKLKNQCGEDKAEKVINHFSELKEMKGYKYKSDYLAIKKWGISAYEQAGKKTSNGFNRTGLASCDQFSQSDRNKPMDF